MKLVSVLFLFQFYVCCAFAQKENTLPVDENGKLIYFELVALKTTPKDLLRSRALSFIKKQQKDLKLKAEIGDSTIIASGKMIISKTLLVMSHPSGEVLYHFQVEVKDEKYRFWLTDFKFIPYQRDRYGNFVPNTTVGIPLENNPGKLNAAEWKEYKAQTAKYAQEFAVNFKKYLANESPAIQVKEKALVKKEW